MTDYELNKQARKQAVEMAALMKSDGELLDLVVPPRYMNIEEAAKFTRIPIGTLRQKVKEIPHTKVGKRLVFTDRGLVKWMERKE